MEPTILLFYTGLPEKIQKAKEVLTGLYGTLQEIGAGGPYTEKHKEALTRAGYHLMRMRVDVDAAARKLSGTETQNGPGGNGGKVGGGTLAAAQNGGQTVVASEGCSVRITIEVMSKA